MHQYHLPGRACPSLLDSAGGYDTTLTDGPAMRATNPETDVKYTMHPTFVRRRANAIGPGASERSRARYESKPTLRPGMDRQALVEWLLWADPNGEVAAWVRQNVPTDPPCPSMEAE